MLSESCGASREQSDSMTSCHVPKPVLTMPPLRQEEEAAPKEKKRGSAADAMAAYLKQFDGPEKAEPQAQTTQHLISACCRKRVRGAALVVKVA